MTVLTQNMDTNPYTGVKRINGNVKLKDKSPKNTWLDKYFNGTTNCEQIKNMTRGKTYNVIKKEGFGDVEDITIIDDTGKEQTLGSFFFEEITE